jgi:hypothetical protein
LLVPTVAAARPFTAGVGVGAVQAEQDWDKTADDTLHAFARLGLTDRVSAQIELQKIDYSQNDVTARTGTALLFVELGRSGRLVPTMFGGIGLDHAEDPYGGSEKGHHIEGGLGLEYRLDGGLVIGADVRLGGRAVDQQEGDVILDGDVRALVAPLLVQGEYRSFRFGVGLRF